MTEREQPEPTQDSPEPADQEPFPTDLGDDMELKGLDLGDHEQRELLGDDFLKKNEDN